MSRVVWSFLAPFCVVLAVIAVITIARESSGGDDTTAVAAAGEAGSVLMESTAFAPTDLSVARGTEVVFDNKDVAPHTVTADDGSVDSGVIDPGGSFRLVVDGSLAYHCEIHPSMKATIGLSG